MKSRKQRKNVSKEKTIPKYTGLKDFVRGCKKLLSLYGNVPVFIEVAEDKVAPFGMAISMSDLLGGEAIVLKGGYAHNSTEFTESDCTE